MSAIIRIFNSTKIVQREDGYFNATQMCLATNKLFADYNRLKSTQEFLGELERSMGIPIDRIVEMVNDGPNEGRGTWIEPHAAINLAQWCSPKFAVLVSKWVFELLTTGKVELQLEPTPAAEPSTRLDIELTIAEAAARMLRLDDSSKLNMMYKISEGHNVPTAFLPDYTEDRPTQALTMLLKEHCVNLTAAKANKILLELGILENKTRESTKVPGRIKTFKVLTEAGLKYGKNVVNHNNQRETAPHYYCDMFGELLGLIDGYLAGNTVMGDLL